MFEDFLGLELKGLIKNKLSSPRLFSFNQISTSYTEKEIKLLNIKKVLKKDDGAKSKNYRPVKVYKKIMLTEIVFLLKRFPSLYMCG